MAAAVESLKLDGLVGVNNSDELVEAMFKHGLVAGLEFNHPAVNILTSIEFSLNKLMCTLYFRI